MGLRKDTRVCWTKHNGDIPEGSVGSVVGFTTDHVEVTFPKGTWAFKPEELQTEQARLEAKADAAAKAKKAADEKKMAQYRWLTASAGLHEGNNLLRVITQLETLGIGDFEELQLCDDDELQELGLKPVSLKKLQKLIESGAEPTMGASAVPSYEWLTARLGLNESDDLPSVIARLDKLGVGCFEDLQYCETSHLKGLGLKPIKLKKLQKLLQVAIPTAPDEGTRAKAGAASPSPAPKGPWDCFLSHTRRSPQAHGLALKLVRALENYGKKCWLDVDMDSKSTASMEEGVKNSKVCIAIITGPCQNPDRPTDKEEHNAYFNRPFCVQELRWAREAGVPIQPVVVMKDKDRIGELLALAPEDLKDLGDIDFIDLNMDDKDYWLVGVQKILRQQLQEDLQEDLERVEIEHDAAHAR